MAELVALAELEKKAADLEEVWDKLQDMFCNGAAAKQSNFWFNAVFTWLPGHPPDATPAPRFEGKRSR